MAPRHLAAPFQRLPPILHILPRSSLSSYSKGSRGLSVLPRVKGIFTLSKISLSPWLRQRGNRYAIHAGRNLPDKEFRYLRTVIVTAAVYWGFDSTLSHLLLTFQHRAGVRPYTFSYEFAESCVFSKQSPPPLCCDSRVLQKQVLTHTRMHLLPKLRCNFAKFLNQSCLKRLRILSSPT